MNKQEIFELMDRFEKSVLQSMRLTQDGFSIELHKGAGAEIPQAQSAPAPAAVQAAAAAPSADAPVIAAPLTGVFYTSPAPDQPPFVAAGQKVEKGQTVCLLEAMKMMSEIPAPCDCVIEKVLKGNGELAAYGDALFSYRPC